jgi:hypothetical protein
MMMIKNFMMMIKKVMMKKFYDDEKKLFNEIEKTMSNVRSKNEVFSQKFRGVASGFWFEL